VTARTPLALLAGLLALSSAVLLVWAPGKPGLYGLLLGATAGVATLALVARDQPPEAARAIADESVSALIATAGALMILLGVAVGLWLVLIGIGVLVGGIAGVVRELRA
jgi:predicted phage tail protein